MSWLRRLARGARWDGTTGRPRSGNGASSFHLIWEAPVGEWIGAEAVFELRSAPVVAALYFWALQVSFLEGSRQGGSAHLGLQWYPAHPGSTAVNWGGYGPDGRELDGSVSPLPSATNNVNTRDFTWSARSPYRLTVARGARQVDERWTWRGEVTDVATGTTTVVRELLARGSTIASPMVWSEVFADCDAPGVSVRWTDLALISADGDREPVTAVRVNYQHVDQGGCTTTNSSATPSGFVQECGTTRETRQASRLELG